MKKIVKILPIVLVIWPIINLVIQINMKRGINFIAFFILEAINIAFMIVYLKKNKKLDMLHVNVLISLYLLTSLFIPVFFIIDSDHSTNMKRTGGRWEITPDTAYYNQKIYKYNIYGIDISGIDTK